MKTLPQVFLQVGHIVLFLTIFIITVSYIIKWLLFKLITIFKKMKNIITFKKNAVNNNLEHAEEDTEIEIPQDAKLSELKLPQVEYLYKGSIRLRFFGLLNIFLMLLSSVGVARSLHTNNFPFLDIITYSLLWAAAFIPGIITGYKARTKFVNIALPLIGLLLLASLVNFLREGMVLAIYIGIPSLLFFLPVPTRLLGENNFTHQQLLFAYQKLKSEVSFDESQLPAAKRFSAAYSNIFILLTLVFFLSMVLLCYLYPLPKL